MTKYKFTETEAKNISKHGIDLNVYGKINDNISIAKVSVKEGHFQEFYDKQSTYNYYILKGNGTFILNDEKIDAKAGDVITIPPKTRIYYFGTLEMILILNPPFDPDNEVHIRDVDKSEKP